MVTLKPARTFEEQLAILEDRGMLIDDREAACRALEQMNYYRLSGYSYQFLNAKGDKFRKTASFGVVVSLYQFDRQLRHILHTALETIEVYARTQIAYHFAHLYGSDAHYDPTCFENPAFHNDFVKTLEKQIEKNKDAPFVLHHIQKYDRKMPLWCAVEVLPFTALSMFYRNIRLPGRNRIANALELPEDYLFNWLHCFAVLRNTCAHYGRIYNRELHPPVKLDPRTYRHYPQICKGTLFSYVIAMIRFMPCPNEIDAFRESLIELVKGHLRILDLGLLGFPEDWEALLFDSKLFLPTAKKPVAREDDPGKTAVP